MSESRNSLLHRTWHHSQFSDLGRLVDLKMKKGLTISLAFPTLNEEATIGKEILIIRTELMDRYPLLDEIVVIDSSSQDNTRRVAERFGARVYESKDILPNQGTYKGKGENLWKSLFALQGDIIVWIDADISNIAPKFVYALVGPLLENDSVGYVKAFYERPIRSSGGISTSGGGRVTEILVPPPLFSFLSRTGPAYSTPFGGIRGKKDPFGTASLFGGLWGRTGPSGGYLSYLRDRSPRPGRFGRANPSQSEYRSPGTYGLRNYEHLF